MSDILSEKLVQTKKDHRCFGCGRLFSRGTTMHQQAIVDGGTVWSCYLCKTCNIVTNNLESGCDFCKGDLLEEALELEGDLQNE